MPRDAVALLGPGTQRVLGPFPAHGWSQAHPAPPEEGPRSPAFTGLTGVVVGWFRQLGEVPDMTLIEPCVTCKMLKGSFIVKAWDAFF
ncbi:hypothetical protein GCM10010149_62340 [Nonomuraea roseoviolacea subsp. roseoviolacea]